MSLLYNLQVRKLEFLFADAINKGCKHVITCGSLQSNFARSTAISAAQLGLKCHLFLRSSESVRFIMIMNLKIFFSLMQWNLY